MPRWLSLVVMAALAPGVARADEGAFLKSLGGSWAGVGVVRIRANMSPINVFCSFNSEATGLALSMAGVRSTSTSGTRTSTCHACSDGPGVRASTRSI